MTPPVLSGFDIITACSSLLYLERCLRVARLDGPEAQKIAKFIKDVRSRIQSRLESPQMLNFSGATDSTLEALNIVGKYLRITDGIQQRAKDSISIGNDKLWSSSKLHLQLKMLNNLIPSQATMSKSQSSTGTIRPWIETFFFRVSTIMPQGKHMTWALNMIRAMLHDENIYPMPFEFNPDRFMKDGKLNPDVRDPHHAAFGFGRR
ncbi:hypothetical protein H0H92_014508 [Tricholoma furcatifolium]|nr:hypothetical protein H0H92_014508 [Tricholoma furcatifolium]